MVTFLVLVVVMRKRPQQLASMVMVGVKRKERTFCIQ